MKKLTTFILSAVFLIGGSVMATAKKWDKTFEKSNDVISKRVNFTNRFGIVLAGDLYIPKGVKKGQRLRL